MTEDATFPPESGLKNHRSYTNTIRIDNGCESFHRKLTSLLYSPKPDIYKFILLVLSAIQTK